MTLRTFEASRPRAGFRNRAARWAPTAAVPAAATAGAGVAAPLAGAAAPGCAPSTSAFTMRPLGPEPFTPDRSMPFCSAMRFASGEAMMRSPDGFGAPVCAGVGAGSLRFCCSPTASSRSLVGACSCAGAGAGRRRRRSIGSLAYILTLAREHRDNRADLHAFGTFGHLDLRDRAFIDGLELHRGLVGLDLGHDVARVDFVAFLDEPLRESALFHGRRKGGHLDRRRHGSPSLGSDRARFGKAVASRQAACPEYVFRRYRRPRGGGPPCVSIW